MSREILPNFIAMEGTDYSGKETNCKLTKDRLEAMGRSVLVIAFPRYSEFSGQMASRYLRGEFGESTLLSPRLSSYFYEVDRALAGYDIRNHTLQGGVAIADRFTGSNMAHQGAKIKDKAERITFYETCMTNEFDYLHVPQPTRSIVLLVNKGFMGATIKSRIQRGDDLDGHERNVAYQMAVIDTYEEMCELYPNQFIPIDCMRGEERLTIEEVNDKVFSKIEEVL